MKFIFLISGMNSWENALPIIYELSKNKKNKIIIGIETKIFYSKFLEDEFRKDFLKKNDIDFLHLGRPKTGFEYLKLLRFYFVLSFSKFDYILETLDFDKDLKLSNFFLKLNLMFGCKRVKIFADSLSKNELLNTQIFYDVVNIKNKRLDFSKYDLTLISNDKEVLKEIYKKIIFSEKNFNIGRIKLNKDWLEYINRFYANKNLDNFDILIPLSATKGKFIKGHETLPNENKLIIFFEVLSKIKNIKVVFKPHSKSDMDYFNYLIKKYNFEYLISNFHLNYLCSKSKIVLTYHPTSAQIYAKCFNKKVLEFGQYDEKIEKILNGEARYSESVDKRILSDKDDLKKTIEFYLNNFKLENKNVIIQDENLSNLSNIIK